jgi:photosystem II stability/assembly factor-like uncharacterized protein
MVRLILLFISIFFFSCAEKSEVFSLETKPAKLPKDIFFIQRAYPIGEIKPNANANALQWKKQRAQNNNSGLLWDFAGPINIGGRITDIEIPTNQPNTYFVGAASGGIFKSINSGISWFPIFDDQPMLSIGDIEISALNNNLVWVGTGEPNAGGGSLAYDGDGVYKSDDGGNTWQAKGLTAAGSIGKVKIDPNNDNIIFVAAMGPLFRKDTNRGVYKTTNAGDTWEQVLFVSDSTGIIDMAIHPTNGNIVYATSWERTRRPNARQYGGETSRIYRTTNGGTTWTELTNGLPTLASQKGRISIDISKSNPNVLYAMYADAIGNVQGVYRTNDAGNSWNSVNSSSLINVGFHWWFEGIFVDPSDEDIIYYLGLNVQKSTNGGTSWFNSFQNAHVDQHALAFNPTISGEILLGNDGGLYKSSNEGATFVKDITLPITQFHRFHVDAQNVNKVYGGAQDNSTIRTVTGGLNNWAIINGGDGFQPLVDPTNTNVIYALSQNGNLGKSINNGVTFSSAMNGIASGDRKNWDTPIAFDPNNSQVLFFGANRLYKTTNAAGNWTAISPDLTNGPHTGNLVFGTIISISVSPLDSNIIYVGTDDGNVWITQNGGGTWTNISADLPNRWVTKVLASRANVNEVYVTFSGYRYGEDFGHIYKSSNLGSNWVDISSNVPDIPINDIEKDSYGNLYIGTDIGVLASNNEGVQWEILGLNLPSVVVTDLHIHEQTETLFAATYGRSSYKMDISGNILSTTNFLAETNALIFPNPTTNFVTISIKDISKNYTISIFDALGREVLKKEFLSGKQNLKLSVSEFSPGTYFIKISSKNESITKKLIIK